MEIRDCLIYCLLFPAKLQLSARGWAGESGGLEAGTV